VLGYRWAAWDIAVAAGYASFSQGKLNPSYAGAATLLHAPKAHYWFVDGELGYNTAIDLEGPRFLSVRALCAGICMTRTAKRALHSPLMPRPKRRGRA
jgi:hypothetical protein